MAESIVQEVTFRLPIELVERVRISALDRRQEADQVVAEALACLVSPTQTEIDRRVGRVIGRLSHLDTNELSHVSKTYPSEEDVGRASELMELSRSRELSGAESAELNDLQDRFVQIAAERTLALKLLRERRRVPTDRG